LAAYKKPASCLSSSCIKWGGPLVRGRRPRRRLWLHWQSRTTGSDADEGVRPTSIYASDFRVRTLVEEVGSVKSVTLLGDEACVADQAAEFFFRGSVMRSRSAHHVFFNHDTADVVSTESQA
jgi:hypothetical protein